VKSKLNIIQKERENIMSKIVVDVSDLEDLKKTITDIENKCREKDVEFTHGNYPNDMRAFIDHLIETGVKVESD
jgi:hypothetical protein